VKRKGKRKREGDERSSEAKREGNESVKWKGKEEVRSRNEKQEREGRGSGTKREGKGSVKRKGKKKRERNEQGNEMKGKRRGKRGSEAKSEEWRRDELGLGGTEGRRLRASRIFQSDPTYHAFYSMEQTGGERGG
jgi:hypothetical protein